MAISLKDKVIVITGASSGIGAETAKRLAAEGAITVLMGRSAERLEQLAITIGERADVYVLDVTSDEQVRDVFERVIARHGTIDVLVNNAGFGVFAPFVDAEMNDFREMMDVNYFGLVRCTMAVLPHMIARGGGQIVNVASMAGKIGTMKSTGYSATKHAVLGFTNCLRQEMFAHGIVVSAVNPGPVDTPFFDRADPSGSYIKNIRWFMLRPDQVAATIVNVIRRRKKEADTPLLAAAGVRLYQLMPRLLDRTVARLLGKK